MKKKIVAFLLALVMMCSMAITAHAELAEFEYKLILTDQNGMTVTNPRSMKVGDTLNVEIELKRTDSDASSYNTYGFEFRLFTQGLTYNGDGVAFDKEVKVTRQEFYAGDSVGFAYYDMQQKGIPVGNTILAGRWSYRVTNPSIINIKVPVAVLYVTPDPEPHEPVGDAILYLDLNGGQMVGIDVKGEYKSGTVITLPGAECADYVFLGWSDGEKLYQEGEEYTVTGIVTLTAQWEGLVRNRQILFAPTGGEIVGTDPSGLYADGEIVVMPEATREGYTLIGWNDDIKTYSPGDEYVVDKSKVFRAEWTEAISSSEPVDVPKGETPLSQWFTTPEGELNVPHILETILGALVLCGLGWWLFLILWKRRWVLYSLKDGSISLDYKDNEHNYCVEVILIDDADNEISLDRSHKVEKKHKLVFIKGKGEESVVKIDPGKYKGKMIITDGPWSEEKKCRIKVLDRELRERENK